MNDRYAPRFGEPVAPWHRWFAWHPVWTADRGTVWLRIVYRRCIYRHEYLDGGSETWFQHAVDIDA